MKIKLSLLFALLISANLIFGQDDPPKDWFHLDLKEDGYPGLSTHKAYKELLQGKESKTVIVAVLDSGIDLDHEDLKGVMWSNKGEKAGNGVDDDKNGYSDDILGWNFIGGKNGENVNHENLEVTRLYVAYKEKFEGKDPATLKKKEKAEYDKYKEYEEEINAEREEAAPMMMQYGMIYQALQSIQEAIGKEAEDIEEKDFTEFKSEDAMLSQIAASMPQIIYGQGFTFAGFLDVLQEGIDHFTSVMEYNYNPEFDARHIVGDNYADPYEKFYGNSDAEGPDPFHGTHVAGIIGAERGNGIGMDGIADNVRIMSVRTVPDGDERDKDVANAIIYAVDNGASIINMSFGKGQSPYKKAVDKAVKYAKKHDVLLVHASGNESEEISKENNFFPNDKYAKKGLFGSKYAKNWIAVGAISWETNENMPADFSNYSATDVDVFAPGTKIYSTMPDNEYKFLDGTSFAAPTVAGVAALLRSYYPSLNAKQVKQIIMDSAVPQTGQYTRPGGEDKVSFKQLCATGGIVNAYNALVLASQTKGKKRK